MSLYLNPNVILGPFRECGCAVAIAAHLLSRENNLLLVLFRRPLFWEILLVVLVGEVFITVGLLWHTNLAWPGAFEKLLAASGACMRGLEPSVVYFLLGSPEGGSWSPRIILRALSELLGRGNPIGDRYLVLFLAKWLEVLF